MPAAEESLEEGAVTTQELPQKQRVKDAHLSEQYPQIETQEFEQKSAQDDIYSPE